MTDTFRVKARQIAKRTAHKGPLYEVEIAPGVSTSVYADNAAHAKAIATRKSIATR